MSIVKVNRSGATHKIYETTAATKQIGTLYNNEMFTWIEEWPGSSASGYYMQKIAFRGGDGNSGCPGGKGAAQTAPCDGCIYPGAGADKAAGESACGGRRHTFRL